MRVRARLERLARDEHGEWMAAGSASERRKETFLAPQTRALPIHAKSGRERGPCSCSQQACSLACWDEEQRSARKNSCAAPTALCSLPTPTQGSRPWAQQFRPAGCDYAPDRQRFGFLFSRTRYIVLFRT